MAFASSCSDFRWLFCQGPRTRGNASPNLTAWPSGVWQSPPMSLFKAERKIWILCGIYFLLALCSLMARATADSLFLKNFDKSSIPLMIMAAAAMSSVVALFITYLCARYQV